MDENLIRKACVDSKTYRDLAIKVGIPTNEIIDICEKLQIKPRDIIISRCEYCKLKYIKKMSSEKIALYLGVNKRFLDKWTAKNKYNNPFFLNNEELSSYIKRTRCSSMDLMKYFGVSYSRLIRYIEKNSIELPNLPKVGKKNINMDKVISLYKRGFDAYSIAKKVNCTPSNIFIRIKRWKTTTQKLKKN